MLLSEEETPAAAERRGGLGSQQAGNAGVAVRLVPAGNFVVAFVLKPGLSAELRIESGGGVASFGQNPDGLICRIAVVSVQVKEEGRVQGVALGV